MSLWTPGGEVPVGREREEASPPGESPTAAGPASEAEAEALAREIAAAREQIAQAPASVVIANHVMGLYELAAIHLGQNPPNLVEAAVAIDAMAAVVESLPGRLGENEATLNDALHQLRLAFVELTNRADDAAAEPSPDTAGGDSPPD